MFVDENRKFKSLTSAKRLTNSLVVGNDICEIGRQKNKIKEAYYEKKLLLLERQTIALENIAASKQNNKL